MRIQDLNTRFEYKAPKSLVQTNPTLLLHYSCFVNLFGPSLQNYFWQSKQSLLLVPSFSGASNRHSHRLYDNSWPARIALPTKQAEFVLEALLRFVPPFLSHEAHTEWKQCDATECDLDLLILHFFFVCLLLLLWRCHDGIVELAVIALNCSTDWPEKCFCSAWGRPQLPWQCGRRRPLHNIELLLRWAVQDCTHVRPSPPTTTRLWPLATW